MRSDKEEGENRHTRLVVGDHLGESKSSVNAHGQLRIVQAGSDGGEVRLQVLHVSDKNTSTLAICTRPHLLVSPPQARLLDGAEDLTCLSQQVSTRYKHAGQKIRTMARIYGSVAVNSGRACDTKNCSMLFFTSGCLMMK